jgi:hypothetical protein
MLISTSLYNLRNGFVENDNDIMVHDVAHLAALFNQINTDAGILSFDQQYNSVNFLTIKKNGFVGTEVGPMKLAHADKWAGPYALQTIRMQKIPYAIVQNKNGYFVTPGKGVTLHNGKIIGQDIKLDFDEDLEALSLCENILCHHGAPLVAKIHVWQNALGLIEQKFLLSD